MNENRKYSDDYLQSLYDINPDLVEISKTDIKELEAKAIANGWNVWEKNGMRRLYLTPSFDFLFAVMEAAGTDITRKQSGRAERLGNMYISLFSAGKKSCKDHVWFLWRNICKGFVDLNTSSLVCKEIRELDEAITLAVLYVVSTKEKRLFDWGKK